MVVETTTSQGVSVVSHSAVPVPSGYRQGHPGEQGLGAVIRQAPEIHTQEHFPEHIGSRVVVVVLLVVVVLAGGVPQSGGGPDGPGRQGV